MVLLDMHHLDVLFDHIGQWNIPHLPTNLWWSTMASMIFTQLFVSTLITLKMSVFFCSISIDAGIYDHFCCQHVQCHKAWSNPWS